MDSPGIGGLAGFDHVAVVTDDLDGAMEAFAAAFDLTWPEPWSGPIPICFEGRQESPLMTFTYSKEGPPHLELIQAIPNTVWQPVRGIHHVGIWVDDVARRAEGLCRVGFRVEVKGEGSEFAYLLSSDGFRLELVDQSARPDFARWTSCGSL